MKPINVRYLCVLLVLTMFVMQIVSDFADYGQNRQTQESLVLQPESALYTIMYSTDQNKFLEGSRTGSVQEITIEMALQLYQQLQIYDSLVTLQINQRIKDYDVTQETMVNPDQLQDIIAMINTSHQAYLKYVEAEMMLTGAEIGNGSLRAYYEYKKGMELLKLKNRIYKKQLNIYMNNSLVSQFDVSTTLLCNTK